MGWVQVDEPTSRSVALLSSMGLASRRADQIAPVGAAWAMRFTQKAGVIGGLDVNSETSGSGEELKA